MGRMSKGRFTPKRKSHMSRNSFFKRLPLFKKAPTKSELAWMEYDKDFTKQSGTTPR